jgi:hypothetical protein
VAFDQDMNPVLRDCVELYHTPTSVHPQKGRHAPSSFVFRGAEIVSVTIKKLSSPSNMLVVWRPQLPYRRIYGGASLGSLLAPHVTAAHSY